MSARAYELVGPPVTSEIELGDSLGAIGAALSVHLSRKVKWRVAVLFESKDKKLRD